MPKLRKPNHRLGGFQVRICGKQIQGDLVCSLPPERHENHAVVATGIGGSIYVFLKKGDGDVETWQLVGPHG